VNRILASKNYTFKIFFAEPNSENINPNAGDMPYLCQLAETAEAGGKIRFPFSTPCLENLHRRYYTHVLLCFALIDNNDALLDHLEPLSETFQLEYQTLKNIPLLMRAMDSTTTDTMKRFKAHFHNETVRENLIDHVVNACCKEIRSQNNNELKDSYEQYKTQLSKFLDPEQPHYYLFGEDERAKIQERLASVENKIASLENDAGASALITRGSSVVGSNTHNMIYHYDDGCSIS